jgi:hypothetical protein
MRMLRLVVFGCLAWALAPGIGHAAILDVCAQACTYSSIQAAVDAAAPGDVIDIRAGTYAGDVDVSVSSLTFTGAGAGVTIVEGLGFATFIFRDTATPVTLSGVTLRSPGVTCVYNYGASLTVRDSVIEDCVATQYVGNTYAGGGIYTTGDLLLERVTVRNNAAHPAGDGLGGGLYVVAAAGGPIVRILASELSGNTAFHGGAIYVEPGARLFVDGTRITGNRAYGVSFGNEFAGQGGGIWTAQAFALGGGSPAIDSGGVCQVVDQGGHQRPADGGSGVATCDRGAVEVESRCGPPLPAEALEPASGAVGVALAPILVWKPAYNALTYDIVLATQVPPAEIVETVSGITATHWKPQVALSPGTTYFWQVRAHSPCGKREVSPVFDFTTQ